MSKEILLTGNQTLTVVQRMVNLYTEACTDFGYTARVLYSFDMYKETQLPYAAINLAGYPNETHLRFTRKLEIQGVKVVNPVYNAAIADDKAMSILEISNLGLPTPKTLDLHVSSHDRRIPEFIKQQLGFPCVVKFPRLGYGMGVKLINTEEDFISIFDLLCLCASKSANYQSNTNLIVQEYIPETLGKQIKVFVLNKKVIGSYYYENPDNWKIGRRGPIDGSVLRGTLESNNLIFKLITIDTELEKNCIDICNALNLNFACIDIFYGKNGFLFNEINTTPGFGWCYPDVPAAHLVIEYLINLPAPKVSF